MRYGFSFGAGYFTSVCRSLPLSAICARPRADSRLASAAAGGGCPVDSGVERTQRSACTIYTALDLIGPRNVRVQRDVEQLHCCRFTREQHSENDVEEQWGKTVRTVCTCIFVHYPFAFIQARGCPLGSIPSRCPAPRTPARSSSRSTATLKMHVLCDGAVNRIVTRSSHCGVDVR